MLTEENAKLKARLTDASAGDHAMGKDEMFADLDRLDRDLMEASQLCDSLASHSTPASPAKRTRSSAGLLPVAAQLELERAVDKAEKDARTLRAELGATKEHHADQVARLSSAFNGVLPAETDHLQRSLDTAHRQQLEMAATIAELQGERARTASELGQMREQLKVAERSASLASNPRKPIAGGDSTPDLEHQLQSLRVENGALREKEKVLRERDGQFTESQLALQQLQLRVQLLERELLRRGVNVPPPAPLPTLGSNLRDPYAASLASAQDVGELKGRLRALEEQNDRLLQRLSGRGGADANYAVLERRLMTAEEDIARLRANGGSRGSHESREQHADAGRMAMLENQNGRLQERVKYLEASFNPNAAFSATIAERDALDLRVSELVVENGALASKEKFLRKRNEELEDLDRQLGMAKARIRSLERELVDNGLNVPAQSPNSRHAVTDGVLMERLLASTEEQGRLQGRIQVLTSMLAEATRTIPTAVPGGSSAASQRELEKLRAQTARDGEKMIGLSEQLSKLNRDYSQLIEGDGARKGELQAAKDRIARLEARSSAHTVSIAGQHAGDLTALEEQVTTLTIENAALAAKEKLVRRRNDELSDMDRQLVLAQLRNRRLERALEEAGLDVPAVDSRTAAAREDLSSLLMAAGEQGALQGRVELLQREADRLRQELAARGADGANTEPWSQDRQPSNRDRATDLRLSNVQGQLEDEQLKLGAANREIGRFKGRILVCFVFSILRSDILGAGGGERSAAGHVEDGAAHARGRC